MIVLGASGFLGAWTTRALLSRGHEVTIVSRPESDTWRLDGVGGLERTRAITALWPNTIETIRPEVVLSFDWDGVAGSKRDDPAVQRANIDRQLAILESAARAGVRRFVGVGSQAEYGPQTSRIAESTEPHPTTEYGSAKLETLRSVSGFCGANSMEWVWGRVFSVYGPLEGEGWLLPSIASTVRTGQRMPLTSGEQRWSYLFAADAARAMSLLATHENAAGIFNVAHPESPALRDSISLFATRLGAVDQLDFGAASVAGDAISHLEADIERLSGLGWMPKWTQEDGLTATADWLRGSRIQDPFDSERWLPRKPSL